MASLSFRLTTNNLDGRIRAVLMAPDGIVTEEVKRRGRNVSARARQLARERSEDPSGALSNSYRLETHQGHGFSIVAQVVSNLDYAAWVEDGTGIYGPRRTPIRPRTKRYLSFFSRKYGVEITTSSVRGQRPKHILRDALDAARL